MPIQEMRVQSPDQEDPQEKALGTHSSVLAWRIPWTEEPGGLQSMGSHRVGHDLATEQQLTLCLENHVGCPASSGFRRITFHELNELGLDP